MADAEAEQALTDEESAQWRSFLARTESVTAQVEQALVAAVGMSATEFGVLVRIYEASGVKFQHELQHELHWSASRLSHQLTRTQQRGLIERRPSGPGLPVELLLTDAGVAALERARGPHGAAVRRFFFTPRP